MINLSSVSELCQASCIFLNSEIPLSHSGSVSSLQDININGTHHTSQTGIYKLVFFYTKFATRKRNRETLRIRKYCGTYSIVSDIINLINKNNKEQKGLTVGT